MTWLEQANLITNSATSVSYFSEYDSRVNRAASCLKCILKKQPHDNHDEQAHAIQRATKWTLASEKEMNFYFEYILNREVAQQRLKKFSRLQSKLQNSEEDLFHILKQVNELKNVNVLLLQYLPNY